MLKALSIGEKKNLLRFLDETEFLLSTEANKEVLMHGVEQIKKGKKGKTIKTSELWR